MTVTDQIIILDRKNMQNEAQYDLDRKAAKISALSSNNLDKYEYSTGEDLGLKPSTVEQAKFESSPLDKIFNKEQKEEKKKGLLKRLKKIENKNKEQLTGVQNKTENIKEVTDFLKEPLRLKAKGLIEEIRVIQKDFDYRKLKITGGNRVEYDFSDQKTLKKLFRDLYYRKITIDEAEVKQEEVNAIISALDNYIPNRQKYIEAKNKLLIKVEDFYKGRKKLLRGLKIEYFRLIVMKHLKKKLGLKKKKKSEEKNIRNENGLIDYGKLDRLIALRKRDLNTELIKKHFQVYHLNYMLENLEKSKTNPKRKKKKKFR